MLGFWESCVYTLSTCSVQRPYPVVNKALSKSSTCSLVFLSEVWLERYTVSLEFLLSIPLYLGGFLSRPRARWVVLKLIRMSAIAFVLSRSYTIPFGSYNGGIYVLSFFRRVCISHSELPLGLSCWSLLLYLWSFNSLNSRCSLMMCLLSASRYSSSLLVVYLMRRRRVGFLNEIPDFPRKSCRLKLSLSGCFPYSLMIICPVICWWTPSDVLL